MNKDFIFGLNDHNTNEVSVPEWNCTVKVRSFSGADRARLLRFHNDSKTRPNMLGDFNSLVCVLSVVDDAGDLMFTEKDISALNAKNGAALDRIAKAALAFNGLAAEAVQDAEKN